MVFAAGRGERMAPLSTVIPKPALEVLGRPLVASALAHLRRAGCGRLVVNLHHGAERVAAAARAADPESLFSWEPELLGGAGGLAAARALFDGGAVLAANADIWADLDLAQLHAAADDTAITLALLPHPDPERWSSVVLGRDGRVQEFVPAGARGSGERYLFTGFQAIGAAVLKALPPVPAQMAVLWEPLRGRGALRGVVVQGAWNEVGTPEAYARLIRDLLAGNSWVHPQAAVAADAHMRCTAVGAGCRVGEAAHLEEVVLTAGAAAGDRVEMRRCVVAGGVTVSGTATGVLITPAGRVPLR
jgi:NDP-sugar pyrophosphorylase family protein